MSGDGGAQGAGDIASLIKEATEAAQRAHASRQRADDDASYAHNAKVAAEEHSKAIAAFKGQAEADANWFTTTKQGVDQAQATINQIKAEAEATKQAVAEARSEVDKGRASVKAGAGATEGFRAQAEKSAEEAANYSKAAAASVSGAEESATGAAAAKEKLDELLGQAVAQTAEGQLQLTAISEVVTAISKLHAEAKSHVSSMADADKKANEALETVLEHEADLARLRAESGALHARIESLLPNATSAGLATAFREQQSRFVWPQRGWLAAFIGAIIALTVSSVAGLPPADGTWDQMARHLVNRLPLIAPLIWLAVYAGRHYGLALRLQEEYAYKEAVSAAFEGYKREMASVSNAGAGALNPLVTLCENVLRTLGQRPGRIYESKHEDITALTPLASAMKDGVQAAAGAVRGQLPGPSGPTGTAG